MKSAFEIIKIGAFLMAVCALASLGLALTNRATAPLIAEQKRIAREMAMKEVLPGAVEFEDIELSDGRLAFNGKNSSGETIGMATIVSPKGYGGVIETMVGMDADFKVTGIKILNMQETPGLGAKAGDPAFSGQYKGKTGDQLYLSEKDVKAGEIDAITASTITSRAVTNGVREAVEAMKNAE